MKRLVFPFCFLLFPFLIFSQPTLTSWDVNPVAGEVVTLHIADPSGFNPGNGGANVTWNFSTLASTATSGFYYVEASLTPYGYLFPQANLGQNLGNNTYGYYQVNWAGIAYCGGYSSDGPSIYTDPENLMIFPFSYTSYMTDYFAASFVSGGNHYIRKGTVNSNGDGYGTLILPWGTVNNVLRVHSLENYSDSTTSGITYCTADNYYWYKGGTHHPVVTYRNLITGIASVETLTYLDPVCVGMVPGTDIKSALVFPNPASDRLHLDFDTKPGQVYRISMTALSGEECLLQSVTPNPDGPVQLELDLAQLASGLYLLRIESGRELMVRKVNVLK